MITRRHIRTKVMQSVYAMQKSVSEDLKTKKQLLEQSIDSVFDLYVLNLQLMVAVQKWTEKKMSVARKKILATEDDLQPNTVFLENELLCSIAKSSHIESYFDSKKLKKWDLDNQCVKTIGKELQKSELYKDYIKREKSSYQEDKNFVIRFFTEIVAPNKKLISYYEDKNMTWVADFPFVNSLILKKLELQKQFKIFTLGNLYKDEEDKKFAVNLLDKVILNQAQYKQDIKKIAQNWEADRIASIDMILIQMAMTEFLYFPSIPNKVTINEYIELAKDFSTPKSGYFINGILDKLAKGYLESKRMIKSGRGLL